MEKWFVNTKKADFNEIAAHNNISPILARILRNRDLTDQTMIERYLRGTMKDCYDPALLLDMDKAVLGIIGALKEKQKIRVIGDYDVDGVCSTYILTEGLKRLGANVDAVIPHRVNDGYGLNDSLILDAADQGVHLIITCDNGIAAGPQVELANSHGMEVIVTDHHEVPYEQDGEEKKEILPKAIAVVDPKRKDDTYPFSGICGGLVAYKVIQALYHAIKKENIELWQEAECERTLDEFVEFVALATVCDVMELKDENRIFVKEGLKRLRHSANLGLQSLMRVNEVAGENLSTFHLGFVIGPCLNATGRLDSAQNALGLLSEKDPILAMEKATWLKQLNDSRKNLTLKGLEQAVEQIESGEMAQDRILVVYLPEIHESLAGIIAGKIRERYYKPTFVLTKAEEGVKGSGRSIDTYHMFEGLNQVKELLTKFGGHKLAAGLSLPEENVEELRKRLNRLCSLTEEDFYEKVSIDIPMPLSYATKNLAEELVFLEPFGVGNPKPLFAQKDLHFTRMSIFGKNRNVLKFQVQDEQGFSGELIHFGDVEKFEAFMRNKHGEDSIEKLLTGRGSYAVSVTYLLGINSFRGKESLQFEMKNYL